MRTVDQKLDYVKRAYAHYSENMVSGVPMPLFKEVMQIIDQLLAERENDRFTMKKLMVELGDLKSEREKDKAEIARLDKALNRAREVWAS